MKIAVLVLALAACHPYYRDNELRGRAALDPKDIEASITRANAVAAGGDHAGAEAILRAAIDRHPFAEAPLFVAWADQAVATGHVAKVRAVLTARLALGEDYVIRARLDATSATPAPTLWAVDELDQGGIETALTRVGYGTLGDLIARIASEYPTIYAAIAPAVVAYGSTDPAALGAYFDWIDAYGEPDHTYLVAIDQSVRENLWLVSPQDNPLGMLAQADALAAAGETGDALLLYSWVRRGVPDAVFAEHARSFEAAARAVTDPASVDPVAYQLGLDGDDAVAAGQLGVALRSFRLAVRHAPWWADARRKLAALLDAIGLTDEASDQRTLADLLAPGA